jgi:hypothetical protein
MRRSRIRDPTWQSIASVVDPLFRLAMLLTPAWPIPPRLTSLAAAWIACIRQFWLHRKMRVSEANAAIGESREQCCPERAANPSQRAASDRSICPCANSATQIRRTSRWQRATGLRRGGPPPCTWRKLTAIRCRFRCGRARAGLHHLEPPQLPIAHQPNRHPKHPPQIPGAVISNWQTGDILIGRLQACAA